jgi:hypothetical protein
MTKSQGLWPRGGCAATGRRRPGAASRRLRVVMLAAGALYAAGRAQAQTDALGIAPPRTVSVEAAQAALVDGVERLGARYARWQRARIPAPSADTLPVLPANAAGPAAPDAPDGEITQQLGDAGR